MVRWSTLGVRASRGVLRVLLAVLPPDTDLVVVEGYKWSDFPKLEIYRPAHGKGPLWPEVPGVVAVGQPTAAAGVNMSKARKLEPPMPAPSTVYKHGLARMPMSRKKRVFTKFNACKCCPMDQIKEEDEEMIGRVMEERSPEKEEEPEMVGEVEENKRGIFGVTNPEKVEVTVDSGASQSVWPRRMKGVKRFYEKPCLIGIGVGVA